MKYTFYTDLHLFTPIAIRSNFPLLPEAIDSENAFLLGDIYDKKGCKAEDKEAWTNAFNTVRSLYLYRYAMGNHEMTTGPMFIVSGKVLMTHGHYVCWDTNAIKAFANSKPFSGFGIFKRMIDWARNIWPQSISDFEVKEATRYCQQYGCDTIVYGHSHTKKLLVKKVNGITIYNLPRGKTVLEL